MRNNILKKIDWVLVLCYLLLIMIGWVNIYASIYNENIGSAFSLANRSGNQFLWICMGIFTAIIILFVISPKIYPFIANYAYILSILLLIAVLLVGKEVNGAKSWFSIGPFSFQPAEISKISTSLTLSLLMSKFSYKFSNLKDKIQTILIIFIPIILLAAEPEFGTILVYFGFFFVLYREGLSGWFISFSLLAIILFILTLKFSSFVAIIFLILVMGILNGIFTNRILINTLKYSLVALILSFIPKLLSIDFFSPLSIISSSIWAIIISLPFILQSITYAKKKKISAGKFLLISYITSIILIYSVQIIFNKVLKEHHRDRIENLLGITEDPYGIGYNINQSKIAIGSGGFLGKGFLQGTQTKFDFVPEQSTDFIFCTIGEEWGFLGSLVLLAIYFTLIIRIILLAEKQKEKFNRIYGYCIASCFFMHVIINIGMTIGLFPVIGIPLPFISYGGSSFITFTTLLFIFIRLDLERWK